MDQDLACVLVVHLPIVCRVVGDTATLGANITGNPRLLLLHLLIAVRMGKLLRCPHISRDDLSSLRVIKDLLKSFPVLSIHVYSLLLEHGLSLSDEYATGFVIDVAETPRGYKRT